MSRERITGRVLKASDPSFGQSANNYWRNRAKDAVMGALSEVQKELMQQAQQVTDEEAEEIGVEPANYGENAPEVAVEAAVEEVQTEEGTPTTVKVEEEVMKMAMVFEPRSKKAGAPVDPSAIAKENWFQVQEKFPQYTKQKGLTMLAVAPTSRNMEAVNAVTDALDEIASTLEENGDSNVATQIDVISDLLTASVNECKKIAEKSKTE